MEQYLIIPEDKTVFSTNWYDYENCYLPNMIVIDLYANKFTIDGIVWNLIEEDHL